ncbi:MAG TPA: 30S ribosomal protein S4 [Bacillota bacterium]|jgi:small subunit ribosomal protein S4|nr:30S ribosomal protein S4 [Bacillota bacterium]HOA36141.1 30S ribosomal protein S4 [Bacillota bacterium]HOJ84775.1 30S ribosomal protein S4 [Bacillota bacterium]HOL15945.1 30S ribosomal protein S4 [Bacillota bacterium]HPZ12146.1 30S ribosomal protein S4 [Bacillota bacterium]
MARYRDAVCRLCRRERNKLYLKGDRCYTDKCSVARKGYPPGEHGQSRQKFSEYGQQLREKQKAKRIYGILERQFRRYFKEADRRKGVTGENLLQLLESRLDNVVYRMGFGRSRAEARQLVNHGHFQVNGRRVDIPSYLTRPGDVIAVREKSRNLPVFKEIREAGEGQSTVDWLEADLEHLQGKVIRMPQREEIDVPVEEHLIVELYSR